MKDRIEVNKVTLPGSNNFRAAFRRYESGSFLTASQQANQKQVSRNHEVTVQQLVAAQDDALKKTGEAAILRANLTRQAQDYERQLSILRAQLADERVRNQGAQQAAIQDRSKLETENLFLRDELRDEAQRMKSLRLKKKAEDKNPPLTPRKQRTLPYRDGFDDDEIGVLSPTRSSGGRSKRGTPTVSGKRKRKASLDDPIPMASLQLSPANASVLEEARIPAAEAERVPTGKVQSPSIEEQWTVSYMKQILNHRTAPNTDRDLEVLAQVAFPSDPKRKISSIILEETAESGSNDYAVVYARTILSLWSRALKEKFYSPVPIFADLIKFIILLDPTSVAPKLVDLTPVLQAAVDVNGVPRFLHSPVSSQNKGQVRRTPRSALQDDVNSTVALNIIYLMATACRHDENAHEAFWGNIQFEMFLMSLNSHQPVEDIILVVNILSTSLRQDSFGPIQSSELEQKELEYHFIERVTCLLSEHLDPDEGQEEYSPSQICEMRLELLSLLEMVAFYSIDPSNNHGSLVIASHPYALARLFRSLYDEMDALYTLRPEHSQRAALVNRLMYLVYGVIRNVGNVNINEKLARLAGARQKHRLVLSRLAFSEGLYLESGITEEAMEMARQLLEEEEMSPEEAEALFEAFPTGGRLSGKESSQRS
jgi:hypothetical protein